MIKVRVINQCRNKRVTCDGDEKKANDRMDKLGRAALEGKKLKEQAENILR